MLINGAVGQQDPVAFVPRRRSVIWWMRSSRPCPTRADIVGRGAENVHDPRSCRPSADLLRRSIGGPGGGGILGKVSIRRATPADVATVRAITRAAYARWIPVIGREPMPMTADYERAVAEHIIDLVDDDGEMIALIETIPHADHLLIENVAVLPDRQGEGLGDRLLRHAEDGARALGFGEVRLYTNAAFESNIAFYAKRGYREYRRGTIVPGSITVFMVKRLGAD